MQRAALAAIAWLLTGTASLPDPTIDHVTAEAVPLDPNDPAHVQVGSLRYLSGWVLNSRNPRFGGYSALHVKGNVFAALADTGEYLGFHMAALGAIEDVRFGRLPDYPGRTGAKSDRDSESLAVDPATGRMWVGFEQYNAIYRFAPGFAKAEASARPAAMAEWPSNEGPESLARLSDGRFITIQEGKQDAPEPHPALLFPKDPTAPDSAPIAFSYRPPENYAPTDAAQLPDGRLVVLNRHFRLSDGMWAAVTVFDPKDIKPGQTVPSTLLAEIRPPLTIDNMEGLSVTQEGGRTILWLISDDNQNGIQKTLLMKFALEEK
ncbi:esterase-like activity of phytase family protein [Sphingomonas crocodyli]|uniref:Esterase-like activity of phytase family protein n=1 Tax=Sphingomonas crocodyli TaxID=1979270 RepID=A0A437M5H6_9SPHN|nr:esterase-like activity of phytase family protein [Sphingomonas crocodyli]RVT92902.1 esterase-like activity of phytase family protein [Sphingomonas crocodyli]